MLIMKILKNIWNKWKSLISWVLFDFGNSSYDLIIASFIFPIYFRETIVGENFADLWWGLAVGLSLLGSSLLAPTVGIIADKTGKHKNMFLLFTLFTIISISFLYFSGPGTILLAFILFVIANICYEIAIILYDSLLYEVAPPKWLCRVSSISWGFGYFGGVLALILLKPLYDDPALYKFIFPAVGLFFLFFSLPALLFIKKDTNVLSISKSVKINSIWAQMKKAFLQNKDIMGYISAYALLYSVWLTVFVFLPSYAKTTIGIEMNDLSGILIGMYTLSFFAAIFWGWLSDIWNKKGVIIYIIMIWVLAILLLVFGNSNIFVLTSFILISLVLSATPGVARAWLSEIIPDKNEAEFFGYVSIFETLADFIGPILFGIISVITLNQSFAMLSLVLWLIIACTILIRHK